MKSQGKIYAEEGKYVVDAAPHIMSRIRALFDNNVPKWQAGAFTHKPVYLSMTRAAARDLLWVCDRYPIEIDGSVAQRINDDATEYERILNAVSNADQDKTFALSPLALQLALPPLEHQVTFRNMAKKVRRMLLADRMGLGKTVSGAMLFCDPEDRPGLVVCPTTLCTQWQREIARFLPQAVTHVIKGHRNYVLPPADIYITAYTRLGAWQDVLVPMAPTTVVFDEVQELRHTNTAKRSVAAALSAAAKMCVGLSGTPIYNYGGEIWSVLDAISPGALGSEHEFLTEWCQFEKVREPVMLHSFLKSSGLFLRRTPEDVGLSFGEASKHVYTLDADLEQLKKVQDVMKLLATTMLAGSVNEAADAGRDFDHELRHATGVAKARPAAEFVKLLLDEERKVVLVGYHHDVYDIWEKELIHQHPARVTGHETPAQKDASIQRFINDEDCRVLMLSVRCAAGIDGLQHVCKTIVFGELDWSPHIMDQNVARLLRFGQLHHVQAFFLTVNDGADPSMMKVVNLKRSQHDGLVEGKEFEALVLGDAYDKNRVREMAATYLRSIGEDVPIAVAETGLLAEVSAALRRVRVPTNTEEDMQRALTAVLPALLPTAAVHREFRYGPRGRLDFLVVRGDERIAIECKINSTKKPEVYRQVRRYAAEAGITSVVLFAPWSGIPAFVVDETPVVVVDFSAAGL